MYPDALRPLNLVKLVRPSGVPKTKRETMTDGYCMLVGGYVLLMECCVMVYSLQYIHAAIDDM